MFPRRHAAHVIFPRRHAAHRDPRNTGLGAAAAGRVVFPRRHAAHRALRNTGLGAAAAGPWGPSEGPPEAFIAHGAVPAPRSPPGFRGRKPLPSTGLRPPTVREVGRGELVDGRYEWMMDAVIAGAVFTLGACVGSFLNVVIYRLPQGIFLSLGSRSVCPACRQRIPWFDNLPILSWLLLRGRARCCRARISMRYFAVEVLTALLFLLLFERGPHSPVFAGNEVDLVALGGFGFQAVFLAILVACTFIDLDHRILPDVLTKPGMAIGCLGAAVVPGLAGRLEATGLSPTMDSLLYSVLGLAAGAGLTLAIRIGAHAVFRKEAMGLGDVKFMGMIGAFLGWEGAVLTFFLGCLVGAVGGLVHRWMTGDAYVPFGPFLAVGAVMVLFLRQPITAFLFTAWPEWVESSQSAPWVLSVSSVLCIVLLVVLVRRGRAS